jgi:putative CocE/NonD family hydrolase
MNIKTLLFISSLVLGIISSSSVLADDKEDYKALMDMATSDTMVMMPMRDGVRLATDVYRPKNAVGKLPTILLKTPYNENKLQRGSLRMAKLAVENGYAFVIQNERGRYYSEGEWQILGHPRTDGYDTLSWIEEQEWSSGKVGTFGCSSSAEWQLGLAAQNHPAHTAMVPAAAGAGIGKVGRYTEQGNWYKGGVHQTLFSIWLYSVQQNLAPRFPDSLTQKQLQRLRKSYDLSAQMPEVDWKEQTKKLPLESWFENINGNDGPFLEMVKREPGDPEWLEGGLYHDTEDFGVPALWLNSWYDVSQGPNLDLFNHVTKNASDPEVRDNQYMVIAPNLHCGFWRIPKYDDLIVGERNMGRVKMDPDALIIEWFDYWMKDAKSDFKKNNSKVKYFTMGANEWQTADNWPPKSSKPVTLYLSSAGEANSLYGDGKLQLTKSSKSEQDNYQYDPMNPVQALGGSVCCNSGASPGGSYDQRAIEARQDVLVYSSEPLDKDMEVTGHIDITLYVSSDAKDTDFTVKLVDVDPDGVAYNVDDTIQRARYREGYKTPVFMQKGEVYELNFSPLSTSNLFKAGHRIRLEVSSSKFPQYMRNLNTGGNNYDEIKAVVANNSIHHANQYQSRIVLPVKTVE